MTEEELTEAQKRIKELLASQLERSKGRAEIASARREAAHAGLGRGSSLTRTGGGNNSPAYTAGDTMRGIATSRLDPDSAQSVMEAIARALSMKDSSVGRSYDVRNANKVMADSLQRGTPAQALQREGLSIQNGLLKEQLKAASDANKDGGFSGGVWAPDIGDPTFAERQMESVARLQRELQMKQLSNSLDMADKEKRARSLQLDEAAQSVGRRHELEDLRLALLKRLGGFL